jgi:hypothetical protein
MRLQSVFILIFSIFGAMNASAAECVTFSGLVPAFAKVLGLEPMKAKIQFTSLNLSLESESAERRAYLLSNLEGCSISRDCDAQIYLLDEEKCYQPVLTFRGRFKGLDRKKARDLASIEIESRFETPRIERRTLTYRFDSDAKAYEEEVK